MIDGLGHGDEAATAAASAVDVLAAGAHEPVATLVRRCHEQLLGTRGVVMSLASFNAGDGTMSWLAVGNVEGLLVRARPDARPSYELLLLRGGVVGDRLPTLRAAMMPVEPGDLLILASDGVVMPSGLAVDPDRSPQAVADGLVARYRKGTDDALALVVRWVGIRR